TPDYRIANDKAGVYHPISEITLTVFSPAHYASKETTVAQHVEMLRQNCAADRSTSFAPARWLRRPDATRGIVLPEFNSSRVLCDSVPGTWPARCCLCEPGISPGLPDSFVYLKP